MRWIVFKRPTYIFILLYIMHCSEKSYIHFHIPDYNSNISSIVNFISVHGNLSWKIVWLKKGYLLSLVRHWRLHSFRELIDVCRLRSVWFSFVGVDLHFEICWCDMKKKKKNHDYIVKTLLTELSTVCQRFW